MKRLLRLLTLSAIVFQYNNAGAQSTYAQVFQIIQTHCAGAACHDGLVGTFNIYVTADSLYHELVNHTPVNPAAAANNNKLILPGDVQHSYLLRKVAHGISNGLDLIQPAEGFYMPYNLPEIPLTQIELIRQWILHDAPETGNVADTATINAYYSTGGIDDTYSPNSPPNGSGFQIYCGRIFLAPGTADTEFLYKVNPFINTAVEAYQVSTMMPASDYFSDVLFFQPGGDLNYPAGLRPANDSSMLYDKFGIGSAAGLSYYTLPTGTAFQLDSGQMLDLFIHVQNPHPDSIYSTDLYVNFYTQPAGTAQRYMLAKDFSNRSISIPQNGQTDTFTVVGDDSTQTQNWNLWKLYSHTHHYGTSFNIWLRNPDGSMGAQIYDGSYDYADSSELGARTGRPANFNTRTWAADSLLAINPVNGIIGAATYLNTAGPDTVVWGFAAAAEVMDMGFMYISGTPLNVGITQPVANNFSVSVFPNPVVDGFVLSYQLDNAATVQVILTDMLGHKIAELLNESPQQPGKYTHSFEAAPYKLATGIYLVSFNIGGKVETQKLVVTE